MEAEFECLPDSVRAARQFVEATLAAWDCDDHDRVASLLTTEVVTNAVLHARTAYRLALVYAPPELMVEVWDSSPVMPKLLEAEIESEGGRGLALLEALALRWGARLHHEGKAVWFCLSCGGGSIGAPS